MKTFETAAALALATLSFGQMVGTKGSVAAGDGGDARYIITAGASPDAVGSPDLVNAVHAAIIAGDAPNPKQWGAVGDGVADDTIPVQACHDATPAGGTISNLLGTYRLTATVTIDKDARHFHGTGHSWSGVTFLIDHTAGPGFLVSKARCNLHDFKVSASAARTAGIAGAGLAVNVGILYEGADAPNTFIADQVCERIQCDGHPNIGLLSSGHVWYSNFDQLNMINNGKQGFLIDAGETTGRANLAYNGFSSVTTLTTGGNGGEGLAIGTPTQLEADQALRMWVDNYDGGGNLTDAAVRFGTDDSYIICGNFEMGRSAFASSLGAVKLMGDQMTLKNYRLVGGLISGVTISPPPWAAGFTDGVVLDRARVLTTASLPYLVTITSDAVRNPKIIQKSMSNITRLVNKDFGLGVIEERIGALGLEQVATYDFAEDGGAIGDIIISPKLPTGAHITKAWYEVVTTLTSAGAATVGFGVDTVDPLGILADTAIAALGAVPTDAIPDATAANFVNKLTSDRNIIMSIKVAALTAGKINVFYTYSVSP